MPTDLGGLDISGYMLEIKTATSTFEKDLADCDAESDASTILARTCTVRVDETLRQSPFNLVDSASIIARVTAINDIG